VHHAICRLGNVYGPRQNPHGEAGVVAIFAHHIHTGRAPTLYGHGRPTRDYVYVGDVVSAMLAAVGKSGTYNIATGVQTDVMSVWTGLLRAAARSTVAPAPQRAEELRPVLAELRPGELRNSCLDITLAERELGWRPQVPIEEGLQLTYDALAAEFQRT
jgi:UDP-glucose 4-epimerase